MADKPDIEYITRLARMELSEEEKCSLESDLGAIIGYMDVLSAIDTAGVEPMEHVLGLCNVMRSDDPAPSSARGELLGCAPREEDGFYSVPIAIDAE
ncbi:MAG: Asp-tRNA(Asn)/Glu-tRNA(Gln) amidotransferase subunit GatC [Clostridia bacterium]|nr:Asp-tRNA(Asn)/Glu-tRNA(Gln) amidotransferase subunit GatC [Clostridia bacterium]